VCTMQSQLWMQQVRPALSRSIAVLDTCSEPIHLQHKSVQTLAGLFPGNFTCIGRTLHQDLYDSRQLMDLHNAALNAVRTSSSPALCAVSAQHSSQHCLARPGYENTAHVILDAQGPQLQPHCTWFCAGVQRFESVINTIASFTEEVFCHGGPCLHFLAIVIMIVAMALGKVVLAAALRLLAAGWKAIGNVCANAAYSIVSMVAAAAYTIRTAVSASILSVWEACCKTTQSIKIRTTAVIQALVDFLDASQQLTVQTSVAVAQSACSSWLAWGNWLNAVWPAFAPAGSLVLAVIPVLMGAAWVVGQLLVPASVTFVVLYLLCVLLIPIGTAASASTCPSISSIAVQTDPAPGASSAPTSDSPVTQPATALTSIAAASASEHTSLAARW